MADIKLVITVANFRYTKISIIISIPVLFNSQNKSLGFPLILRKENPTAHKASLQTPTDEPVCSDKLFYRRSWSN